MADIRDWDKFERGRWNWTLGGYDTAFAGRITIGDVDGHVERNGQHLFIEGKHWEGQGDEPPFSIPTGQAICLESLVRNYGHTVMILLGDARGEGNPRAVQMWRMDGGSMTKRNADWRDKPVEERREMLRRTFAAWYAWAETLRGAA
jgi:hypothetical protein